VRLQLAGNGSGANQAFKISVTDVDGNNIDSAQGLSRLAFDPTAAQGVGRNLNVLQGAQNAQLTVGGQPFSSSGNQLDNAVTGVTLGLNGTGTAQVSISRDATQGLKSAQAFVAALNQFVGQANQLQSSNIAHQVEGNISQAAYGAVNTSGPGSLTLEQIGFTTAKDGTISIDQTKFSQSFSANPDSVSSLLANAVKRVGVAVDTAINGPVRSATNALQTATSNGDNPYAAAASQTPQFSSVAGLPSLLSYSPTTRNLYGLAQYLAVSGL
jgi:flagellar hook-associated protein 2